MLKTSAYFGERGILMFERRRSAGKIVQLPVEDIPPSPYQARTTFDEQELAGLAQLVATRRRGTVPARLVTAAGLVDGAPAVEHGQGKSSVVLADAADPGKFRKHRDVLEIVQFTENAELGELRNPGDEYKL